MVAAYPRVRTIHLVLDNLNIHHAGSLVRAFGPREAHRLWRRLTVHYTPTHGSWLNPAELDLSLRARQAFGRDRVPTSGAMAARVRAWNRRANRSRRTRTDKRDARTLLDACATGAYGRAHRLSEARRHVRAELAVRDALVRTRTRYIALAKALVT